ncbi:MAG: hypothetical protein ACYSSL_04480, partial [Planctomycetota bacterium]
AHGGATPDNDTVKTFIHKAIKEVYGMTLRDEVDITIFSDLLRTSLGDIQVPEEDFSTTSYTYSCLSPYPCRDYP